MSDFIRDFPDGPAGSDDAGSNERSPDGNAGDVESTQRDRSREKPRRRELVTVCRLSELAEGQARRFVVQGHSISLFRTKGPDSRVYASNDRCPHMGAQLSWGTIEGNTIVCSWHQWIFSLEDGSCLNRKKDWARAEMYAVAMKGDEIEVEIVFPANPRIAPSNLA